VVTIVGFAPSTCRPTTFRTDFCHGRRWAAQFHQFNAGRADRERRQRSADRVRGKRLEIVSSQGLVIAIDLGVLCAIAVQTGGRHFVQNDAWQFRTLADDGGIIGNFLEIPEHLGDGLHHVGAGRRRW